MDVFDANILRDELKAQMVWRGEILSTGTGNDIRTIIDYLLVGAFQYFGKSTGSKRSLTIYPEDPMLVKLRRNLAKEAQ
ncbi:MAG: hypothetical protein O3A46_02270 [Candidatus Poribacteria bacterium]|nr:hypothetical protein [Candidatus Poribacteria bacterium]